MTIVIFMYVTLVVHVVHDRDKITPNSTHTKQSLIEFNFAPSSNVINTCQNYYFKVLISWLQDYHI